MNVPSPSERGGAAGFRTTKDGNVCHRVARHASLVLTPAPEARPAKEARTLNRRAAGFKSRDFV